MKFVNVNIYINEILNIIFYNLYNFGFDLTITINKDIFQYKLKYYVY